jgi:hypothetical protein
MGDYRPDSTKACSKHTAAKPCFTHNSRPKNQPANSGGDAMNTGANAILNLNRFPHNSRAGISEKEKLSPKNQDGQIFLDKARRGRPGIPSKEYPGILGRAEHYRMILSQVIRINPEDKGKRLWDRMREPLLNARTEDEVTKAVERFGAPYSRDFVPHLSQQILKTLRDPRLPKGPDAQVNFLADSIAALMFVPGSDPLRRVSPRRSRNICQEQRKRERKQP